MDYSSKAVRELHAFDNSGRSRIASGPMVTIGETIRVAAALDPRQPRGFFKVGSLDSCYVERVDQLWAVAFPVGLSCYVCAFDRPFVAGWARAVR